MIRVQAWNEFVSPKFYGPLAIWPSLTISPQSSLNLIITSWEWLMSFPYMPCIPMQIKLIKACRGKDRGALLLREWPCCPFSSTGLVVHVNLSHLSHNAADTACWWPHHSGTLTGVAQLVGCCPTKQQVTGLIPGQGTCLSCRFGPFCWGTYTRGN